MIILRSKQRVWRFFRRFFRTRLQRGIEICNFAVQSTGSDMQVRRDIKASAQDRQNPSQKTSSFARVSSFMEIPQLQEETAKYTPYCNSQERPTQGGIERAARKT